MKTRSAPYQKKPSRPPLQKKAAPSPAPYKMRMPRSLWLIPLVMFLGFGIVIGLFAYQEMRTSKLQSTYLSQIAETINFELKDGPNAALRVPGTGPYNQRLGYSYIPFFIKSLESDDYTVAQQMRASPRYASLLQLGLYPIYKAKTVTGLQLLDRQGQALYSASYPSHVFSSFSEIPPLLVDTLLYIENRELLKPGPVTRNPVIEWDRFIYAALGRLMQNFMPGFNAGGGSTLATQIEKFRYSPGGQTGNVKEKLRQIASASLRVYMEGPDTQGERKKIVLDYLNSTPLSARQGFGEVNSIGDGLWAWFGHDLNEAMAALSLPEMNPEKLRVKALIYREVLALILAQRRPTAYLLTDRGELDNLCDATLDRLAQANVISLALRNAAKEARFRFLPEPPPPPPTSFLESKAANAMRAHLLGMLGLKNLYELDRIDLVATSTLDQEAQRKLTAFLKKMGDREFLESIGLYGFRLLKPENDPAKIKWSVVLYERGEDGNRLRVQADNVDGPFDMNEGVKLDLGSTAKLRTLITYMEIIGELHRRYAGLAGDDLKDLIEEAPDPLTLWAITWLRDNPDATLESMLEEAMNRKYSANPHETFFTGGGAHVFENFEHKEDGLTMDLHEALRDSVNLVFIRLMRDVVNYTIGQGQQTRQELLSDPDLPARKVYLERYADREGTSFLNRYISDYANLSSGEMIDKITNRAHKGATSRTILFRSLLPQAGYAEYAAYMQKYGPGDLTDARLSKLYQEYPADRYSLADRAYITGINPLELWLVGYRRANPAASRSTMLSVSKPIRLESYTWLFRPSKTGAQNTRIRILLETDAFARIQQRWARLGYPFDKLVPSFATAIGSSADRPGALAELVGILLNNGIKKPTLRFEKLDFAPNTPYETVLTAAGKKAERVLDPAIARIVREAMTEVVENGTAKRLKGAYVDTDGNPYRIGGKTGTGDHRFDEFGHGGRVISSRVVNRTGTIVFFIGDRFFGTVTAHVAGEEAADYKFTSALSAQTLKSLAPVLQPIINGSAASPRESEESASKPESSPSRETPEESGHEEGASPKETAP